MPVELHTVLVVLHLAALAVGFGAALLADWIAVRLLFGRLAPRSVAQLRELSTAATAGVVMLWCSGGLLVWCNAMRSPATLGNEKLWGKLLIVLLLTANALILHRHVLPLVSLRVGQILFEPGWHGARALCALAGAVSVTSWVSALYLGAARELNGAVTVREVMLCYGAAVLLTWVAGLALCLWTSAQSTRRIGATAAT